MKIENCTSFTDLVLAVANYGGNINAAAKRAAKIKKCSPRVEVGGMSEYKWCISNYPQHQTIIDKIAGL